MKKLVVIAFNALRGKFGSRVLKPIYRLVWCSMVWSFLTFYTLKFLSSLFMWWCGIVDKLNALIWS